MIFKVCPKTMFRLDVAICDTCIHVPLSLTLQKANFHFWLVSGEPNLALIAPSIAEKSDTDSVTIR